MPDLNWSFSDEATADYDEIARFSLDRFGRVVAENHLTGLEAACELLRDFPQLAPVHPDMRPEVRCLVHRSHRIFYRVEPDRVLIIRILHHAQDTPRAL